MGRHVGREIINVYHGIIHKIIMSGDIFDTKVTSGLVQTGQKADSATNSDKDSETDDTQNSSIPGDSIQKGKKSKTVSREDNEKQTEAGKAVEQMADAATEQSKKIYLMR